MSEFNSTNLVNIEELVKEAEKYEKTEVATLDNGFDLGFYPHFSQDKIKTVLENISNFMVYKDGRDKKSMEFIEFIENDETEQNFMLLVYFFMILEFTHIGEDLDQKKKPRELFPYFHSLLKTGYLIEIVDDVFSPEEVAKVIKELSKVSAISHNLDLFSEEFANQLKEQEDAIKRLQKFQGTMKKTEEVKSDA